MQKILHITDPHIVGPGERIFQIDPILRLRQALSHAETNFSDVSAVLITGDLVHNGSLLEYEILRDILDDIDLPLYLTLGNHDNRDNFRAVFGGHGFVQGKYKLDEWSVILLDTKDNGSEAGCLDGGRLEWLHRQLKETSSTPVLLGMHHPPHNLYVPRFKHSEWQDSINFRKAINKHRNVKHMIFGHVHIGVSGHFDGIPFSISRGTAHHGILDLSPFGNKALVAAAPSYDVLILSDEGVVVHRSDGLDTLPRIRAEEEVQNLSAIPNCPQYDLTER